MPKPIPVQSQSGHQAVQFVPTRDTHAAVDIAFARRGSPEELAPKMGIDLSDKPTILFLIGRGGTGKTTLARYMMERATTPTLTAALDPVNRTLANYAENVSQPETSDPIESARWLRNFLTFAMAGKHPAVIDFGGGDTTLPTLLAEIPDLAAMIEDAGMALVVLYTMAPRIDDLAPFLSLGLQPPATAFVLNDIGDPSIRAVNAFLPLLAQPAVQDAMRGGAQVVWMPRLDSEIVSFIETRRASFKDAAAGGQGVGPFHAAGVRTWLRRMDSAFEGVRTWLV